MNKKILGLAVATAFAGSAFADGHGMKTSISGSVFTTHANVKTTPNSGDSTNNSYTKFLDGDSQVNFNFSKAGENSSVSGLLRFKGSGTIRISGSGSTSGDAWSVSGLFERDYNLSNSSVTSTSSRLIRNEDGSTSSEDAQGNVTQNGYFDGPDNTVGNENNAYNVRDMWIKAAHASGAYIQLGHDQYLDNFRKGRMSPSGGSHIENNDESVRYTGGDMFNALKLGFANSDMGLNAGLVYISDQCATGNSTQFCNGGGGDATSVAGVTSGMAIVANYSNGPIAVSVENLGVKTEVENATGSAIQEYKTSATALGASFDAGVVTPFVNYSTQKREDTIGTDPTTSEETVVTNLGVLVPLGDSTIRVASTTSEDKDQDGNKSNEVTHTELGIKQALGAATFEATYGSKEVKDGNKTTSLALQLSYAF